MRIVNASFQTKVGTVTTNFSGRPYYTNYLQDGQLIVRLVKNGVIVTEMTWQGDGAYPTTNNMRTVYFGNAGKTVEVTEGSAGDVWLQVCAIRGNVDIGQTNHGNYYQRDIKRDVSKLLCASANGKWMFI